MTRPPFPLVWDDSIRRTFVLCPRKFFLESVMHYKSPYTKIDLHAGSCWAHALEVGRRAFYVDGVEEAQAEALAMQALIKVWGDVEAPADSPKSLNRMGEALSYYFQVFPMSTDAAQPYVGPHGPMIEFAFALPLDPDLRHPETEEPIIYAGRSDMIATYAGALSIYDDKTTKSLGATWANQWDLRSQFTGYVWAAQAYGIPATQVLVRGISILKTKLDHAQAIPHRDGYRVDRWHGQVVRDIRRAIECWKVGYWDYAEAEACTTYGGCTFRQPCMAQDPQPWLDTYFIRKQWDPITRTETLLEDNITEQPVINIEELR